VKSSSVYAPLNLGGGRRYRRLPHPAVGAAH
jgi:hypothetical protein